MTTSATVRSGLVIAHHHPGRLRLRAEAFVDAGAAAARTRSALATMAGVKSVGHNSRTGSLLVLYEPHQVDVNQLIARIEELSGFRVASTEDRANVDVADQIIDVVRRFDRLTGSLTGGRLDLGVIVPATLATLGAYSFFKSPHSRLPRWDNLLYWGYSVFIHAHGAARRAS